MQVRNPQWANAQHTLIDLEIDHPEYGWILFTASPNDVEEYGRQLYAEAAAGQFGPVAEYVAHVATATENKSEAERRLQATDWVNQPDVYDPANTPHLTNRDEFLAYRSQVRGIAVNSVAGNLNWPIEPVAIWNQV